MALSYVYAAFGDVPLFAALFFGLKAAVLAIVLEAVFRIGKRALKNPSWRSSRRPPSSASSFSTSRFPIIVFGAALIGFVGAQGGVCGIPRPDSRMATATPAAGRRSTACSATTFPTMRGRASHPRVAGRRHLAGAVARAGGRDRRRRSGTANVFSQIAIFFSKMAMVTFGGAYAVLAYVAQQAVENYGWLKPGEMLDGLGMAETTPGPLIMVLQFVGFMAAFRDPGALSPMLAGTLGGLLATWVTFTPCFLWIFRRRAVHRIAARQQGADRRAVGDHGRGRRGHPQSRDLVRGAHASSAR